MSIKYISLVFFFFISSYFVKAQTTLFVGATLHIGNGKIIENSLIAVEGSNIIYVGKDGDGTTFKNATYIKVEDKHIYPGLIAPHCKIGLNEIDASRPTRDYAEVGDVNPNIQTQIAFNSDSKLIPTLRFNGVLFVQPTPVGSTIPGSSCVMNLSGDNWEESTVLGNDGIHLNWYETTGMESPSYRDEYSKFINKVSSFFDQSSAYLKLEQVVEKNAKYESMRNILNGQKNIYIRANTARGIKQAIDFCTHYHLKPVLVGANECYEHLELIKQNNISIILMNIHRLPTYADEDINLPYKIPGMLKKAGIKFCIGIEGSWEVRNIAFQAGTAAAWGLTQEEALTAVTLDAATILKVDNKIGSIEVNKSASFIVSDGNILNMKENKLSYIYIDGKEIAVNDMQQQLYQKYHKKYFGKEGK